jgi:hypothetical protein
MNLDAKEEAVEKPSPNPVSLLSLFTLLDKIEIAKLNLKNSQFCIKQKSNYCRFNRFTWLNFL